MTCNCLSQMYFANVHCDCISQTYFVYSVFVFLNCEIRRWYNKGGRRVGDMQQYFSNVFCKVFLLCILQLYFVNVYVFLNCKIRRWYNRGGRRVGDMQQICLRVCHCQTLIILLLIIFLIIITSTIIIIIVIITIESLVTPDCE